MTGKNYSHQLDAKNRMRIPAKIREQLGDGYSITLGTGNCLYVYTKEQTIALREKLNSINAYQEKYLRAARLVLNNTWEAVEDKQGRVLIPENLRDYAKLKKNVLVMQGPTCIEIWGEEVWAEYTKGIDVSILAEAIEF